MSATNAYLFVYGTLRKNMASPMSALLARQAELIAEGYMQGELYDLGGYPGAVLSANPADRVRGDVYLLRDAAALFAVLDEYEECTPRHGPSHEYKRVIAEIAMPGKARLSAWTYLYNRPTAALKRIAAGDYLRFLTEGPPS